jgi:hypothetical protein
MPALDPKAEAILAAYMQNGGNQTEAWKAANPDSKAKPQTIHVKASQFFAQDKVRIRIVEIQAKVEDKVVAGLALTFEAHMEKLAQLRDKAEEKGQLSAAITAEVKRGELNRFYVKQVESTVRNVSDIGDDELASIAAGGRAGVAAPPEGKAKPH